MTFGDAIIAACKIAGISPDNETANNMSRLIDYARESMVAVVNRHVYTITRKIEIKNKRYHFGLKDNQPYGRAIVIQNGHVCSNTYSVYEPSTLVIDAADGEAEITFKPTPIYPVALEDVIDVPNDYLQEVVNGIALYIRMREHDRAEEQKQRKLHYVVDEGRIYGKHDQQAAQECLLPQS